jgi:hypothetical protein
MCSKPSLVVARAGGERAVGQYVRASTGLEHYEGLFGVPCRAREHDVRYRGAGEVIDVLHSQATILSVKLFSFLFTVTLEAATNEFIVILDEKREVCRDRRDFIREVALRTGFIGQSRPRLV